MHGNELRIFQFGDTAYTQPGAYSCVVSTRYGLLESEPAMLSLPGELFLSNKWYPIDLFLSSFDIILNDSLREVCDLFFFLL
jgi:hypothetical protein